MKYQIKNKTEREIDSILDFEFEFELDLLGILRLKRKFNEIKRKAEHLFSKRS